MAAAAVPRGGEAGASPPKAPSTSEIMGKAANRALGGGIAGAAAMGVNVVSLIWLRTTINYQYRYGTGTMEAMRHLYAEGGILRFYRGIGPALIQGPASRFGDTAANAGVLALMESYDSTRGLPIGVKTFCASLSAATWRLVLMPVDATKTIMQVEGKGGFGALVKKVKVSGPGVLYHGALASFSANFVGHYPWFTVYNTLQEKIPKPSDKEPLKKLSRNALIGFTASVVSDTCSNSIRVIKVYKQANTTNVTYPQAVREVIAKDGLIGLMGRGLKTKILANGAQGICFSVLWKLFEEKLVPKTPK